MTVAEKSHGQGNAAGIHVAVGPTLRGRIFTPESMSALRSLGRVAVQPADDRPNERDMAARLRDCRVVVTGWTTPRLTPVVLAGAPDLELVAHTGGSVRTLIDETLFHRGIRVVNAGHAMVNSVAEFTLMQILRVLRAAVGLTGIVSPGRDEWGVRDATMGNELADCTVGVVGAGQIGRRVIGLLRAFGAAVLVHDPFLPESDALAMGAVSAGLRDLLRASSVVTLHAPALPATRGMIGAAELAAMPDHAWLINTARSALVDTTALVSELKSGRISAALDVFDEEPLPADSPLRGLPNVLLTPHTAFMTRECFRRFGKSTVEEIRRFLAGEPLQHEVTARMLETMA